MIEKQSTLKKYGFDVAVYAEIKNMDEIQFKEYCRQKMKRYEENRK